MNKIDIMVQLSYRKNVPPYSELKLMTKSQLEKIYKEGGIE